VSQGGNYSSCMGFYSDEEDNQFWGQVTASFSTMPKPAPVDWRPYKRWYAVLHRFGPWGKHLGTEHWFAGTTADGERGWASGHRRRGRRWSPPGPRCSTGTGRWSCPAGKSRGGCSG